MHLHFTALLRGVLTGVALNSAVCLLSSYGLRLGYYAPCFAGLAEMCGGELNAALVQTCFFALTGMAGALIVRFLRYASRKLGKSRAHLTGTGAFKAVERASNALRPLSAPQAKGNMPNRKSGKARAAESC